jgi:hypothetical protein
MGVPNLLGVAGYPNKFGSPKYGEFGGPTLSMARLAPNLLTYTRTHTNLDERSRLWYHSAARGRSVAVNMPACQAGDRGFESRRSR